MPVMIFLLVMYPAAWADVAINATNFPDEVFRAYVRTYFDKDYNMVLSDEEIAGATRINVYNVSDISSLKGIEYFTALTVLDCSHTQLTRLDVSKNVVLTTLIYGSQGREGLLITSSGNASCPYQLDFSVYMSSDKFASVSNVKGFASNDASITATYSNGVAMFATRPVKVTYNYATGYGSKTMGVTISGDASSEPTPTPPPTSTPPPFGTSYYYNSGNDGNTWETAYILSSAADFLLLQERVSNGTEGTGKYYKLNANVDMTSVTGWYGIGRDNDPSKSEEEIIHPFTGHFDGQ
ncbi:MAG: hypothetical protein IJ697_07280, partial [Synergistaceae bacterium]|nr:hypothetical protein [Synergistaceae bacterium]